MVAPTRVRLMGIDAPESSQTCQDASGKSYACGAESRDFLQKLISDNKVECFSSKVDMYGRVLGVCFDPKARDVWIWVETYDVV